tara:strand:+ start:316 stop:417 length:102 start_codon:yes stop_codon:yes gene_type:complete
MNDELTREDPLEVLELQIEDPSNVSRGDKLRNK